MGERVGEIYSYTGYIFVSFSLFTALCEALLNPFISCRAVFLTVSLHFILLMLKSSHYYGYNFWELFVTFVEFT